MGCVAAEGARTAEVGARAPWVGACADGITARLPYVALAIFFGTAVFLNVGFAGRPALLFSAAPILFFSLLTFPGAPVAALAGALAAVLGWEVWATRMPPAWLPLLPGAAVLALARFAPRARIAFRLERPLPYPRLRALLAAAALAAAVAWLVVLPLVEDETTMPALLAVLAVAAPAGIAGFRTPAARFAAAAAVVFTTAPLARLVAEDRICAQVEEAGALRFFMTGCDGVNVSDRSCATALRLPVTDMFIPPRLSLTEGLNGPVAICGGRGEWGSVLPGNSSEWYFQQDAVGCGARAEVDEEGTFFLLFDRRSPKVSAWTKNGVIRVALDASGGGVTEATTDPATGDVLTLSHELGPTRWRMPHLEADRLYHPLVSGAFTALAAAPDGAALTASLAPFVGITRWADGGQIQRAAPHVTSLATDNRTGVLYGASPRGPGLLRWNAKTLEPLEPMAGPYGLSRVHVDTARGVLIASSSRSGRVYAWSMEDGRALWSAEAGPGPVSTFYDAGRGLLLGQSRCGYFRRRVD